ncbi:amino acid permease [Rhizosaccharibacter radicis]|uniref:Amino acid permease n=1 Tax=Rhizosaccharibacter radicis TaxID=2782605 RepID=A0ABT1W0G5_9PROT|nr:amino acid permease [Acetobacteraceae bacterium KSS12]
MAGLATALLRRKPAASVAVEARGTGLRRTLGPAQITALGIGSIIGAGIYVMTGNAAAAYAGPAILLSFVLAGLACGFAALCYAELASVMPVAGSAYTYAYATLGELFAWIIGWLMLLEYGIAGSAVASGLSGYLASLLHDLGLTVPPFLHRSFATLDVAAPGGAALRWGGGLDLVAALAIAAVVAVLIRGVRESAAVNAVIVAVKLGVLLLFVGFGIGAVHPHNWTPFVPPSEGGFRYGWPGVVRAASVIFFAYMGFEVISTAGTEARHPQRDLPRGIVLALALCTVAYLAVAAVLVGVVPFRRLGVPDPLAIAVDAMGYPLLSLVVKLGAVAGLSSVLLSLTYGQSRILFAMARDGLMPPLFGRLDPVRRTPRAGTIVLGACMATAAALLPIGIIGDLVSLGTICGFSIVCITVIWHRNRFADAERPFRVPFGGVRVRGVWIGVTPVLGVLFCLSMGAPLVLDLVGSARHGNWLPVGLLGGYATLGALFYASYGYRRSRVGQGLAPIGPDAAISGPHARDDADIAGS